MSADYYYYNYHDLADDAYYIEDEYDTDVNSPVYADNNDNESIEQNSWDNYYHTIANEIDDD